MICLCKENEFDAIYTIINDAAAAYKGVYPRGLLERALLVQRNLIKKETQATAAFPFYRQLTAGEPSRLHPSAYGHDC